MHPNKLYKNIFGMKRIFLLLKLREDLLVKANILFACIENISHWNEETFIKSKKKRIYYEKKIILSGMHNGSSLWLMAQGKR